MRSGASSRSSSTSSAMVPVSTSSRSRASIPGPMPRSSRTRPDRTSWPTGTAAPRMVPAARRYARTVYGLASRSSSSAASASRRSAMWAFSTALVSPERAGAPADGHARSPLRRDRLPIAFASRPARWGTRREDLRKGLSVDYQEYLRRVPKVELHCHFEGTVRASTFADLARKHGVQLPTQDVDKLYDYESIYEFL